MRRGFTLIEMLIVLSIIAILSAMSFAGLMAVRKAAKRSQTILVLNKVDAALHTFRADVGFYPKGSYAFPPVQYETAGFDKGLMKTDPLTNVPLSDNDGVWAPATSPLPWKNGNGLFTSLGTAMTQANKNVALTAADTLAEVENTRIYHIGNFGNVMSDGLAKPPGFSEANISLYQWTENGGSWSPVYVTASPANRWAHVDAVAPVSLGEREIKKIMDHFRMAPVLMNRGDHPYLGYDHYSGEWYPSSAAGFALGAFPAYIKYARPRDAGDAYLRALRQGDAVSAPWHDDYLGGQLDAYLRKDIDGDGQMDILDAYGQPLIYFNEGLPAKKSILAQEARIDVDHHGGANILGSPWNKGCMLQYHPDPQLEGGDIFTVGGSLGSYAFVTDRPNDKGVPVMANAQDIALISGNVQGGGYGSAWIWAYHGINLYDCGDPYRLQGTLTPSRVGVHSLPTNQRGGDVYYCLSKDGTTLVEPWTDSDGSGEQSGSEPYFDRKRNGTYDSNIAPVDARLCAPIGEEREFELLSAGRDRLYHALRVHAANDDNLRPQSRTH